MDGTVPTDAVRLFVHVAEAASFRAAAEALGVPKSTVSRKVAELEATLGARLLRRTTRHVSLTDVGAKYLRDCLPALGALDEAARAVSSRATETRGRLRVTAAVLFGERYLGPVVDAYLRAHPLVELEVVLADRHVDLVQEGFDLAFRAGAIGDTSLVAKPLGRAQLRCIASPSYLRSKPALRAPKDLARHDVIVYTPLARDGRWTFRADRRALHVPVRGRLVVNSLPMAVDAAVRGLGISRVPGPLAEADLSAGRLVAVLDRYAPEGGAFHMVYRRGATHVPRVRAFTELATAHLAKVLPPSLLP